MPKRSTILAKYRGMTLIEVMVTIGLFSAMLIAILAIYSSTFRTTRTRDSLVNMLYDADLIMSFIGKDIRNAVEVLDTYQGAEGQTVVAAMKQKQKTLDSVQDRIVVYTLANDFPNRLTRSIYIGDQVTSVELSTHLQQLAVTPIGARVFEVRLAVEDTVAGNVNTFQTSSAFALR